MNKSISLALLLMLSACGDDGEGDGGGDGADGAGDGDAPGQSGGGQVAAPWDDHCVATFTEDYEAVDSFGDVEFSAQAGEAYLLETFDSFAGGASILYLTSAGPIPFDIEGAGDALPFTSNCTEASAQTKLGVFTDVTLYADEALTAELCTLEAGTISTGSLNYALVGDDLFGSTYEVSFAGLAELCDGAQVAYLEADSANVQEVEYTVVPLSNFASPGN